MCSIAGIMAWLSLCRVRLWGEEDRRISLFIEYEDDVCYLDDNDHLTEYRSGEWKQYIVDLNSQFYEIESIFIEYGYSCIHSVLFLDAERNIIKSEEIEKGAYTLEIPKEATLVFLPIRVEEEKSVTLWGILSPQGMAGRVEKKILKTPFYGKKLSVLGDSISAIPVYQPTGYEMYPDPEVKSTDLWWYQLAKRLGMSVCKVNAYGGSGVTDLMVTASNMAASMGRGKELHMAGEDPDIILVLIGGNDIFSNVPKDKIGESYRKMLDDITETYTKAEIYLCTYFICNINLADPEGWLNLEIRRIAEEYHTNLIDLELCGITLENQFQYLTDGTHPNKKGFDLLSAWAVEELLKK